MRIFPSFGRSAFLTPLPLLCLQKDVGVFGKVVGNQSKVEKICFLGRNVDVCGLGLLDALAKNKNFLV